MNQQGLLHPSGPCPKNLDAVKHATIREPGLNCQPFRHPIWHHWWYHERGKKFVFERFTEKAIKVIMLAQEESRRLGHNFVGTEQILLGVIGEATGIGAKSLKSMGVNLKDTRAEVEKIISRGSGYVAVEIPFTPRAKRVLELSWDEARQLGNNYIGTEHLLLGILREGEGVASRVLENLGVDPRKLRSYVLSQLGKSEPSARLPETPRSLNTPTRYAYPTEANASTEDTMGLLLKRILRLLEIAATRAESESNPGLAKILKRHATELLSELETFRAASQKDSYETPKSESEPQSEPSSRSSPEAASEKEIEVLRAAREEARRLGHNFVGTEQILLGLIQGNGIAAKVLDSLGITLKDARVEVEKIIGRGSGFVAVEIPLTPRAKRVHELAWDEARKLGSSQIGTEHLLLGLIREGDGVAVRVLENMTIDRKLIGERVLEEIQKS
jgi:ATP-dependent Clp protease ATP-binding subunit ClpA